jgi:hypothetical protein
MAQRKACWACVASSGAHSPFLGDGKAHCRRGRDNTATPHGEAYADALDFKAGAMQANTSLVHSLAATILALARRRTVP